MDGPKANSASVQQRLVSLEEDLTENKKNLGSVTALMADMMRRLPLNAEETALFHDLTKREENLLAKERDLIARIDKVNSTSSPTPPGKV
jgi:hypothetical protein